MDRQRSSSRLGASWALARHILRREGGGAGALGALYRGLTPNLVGNTAGWSLYFTFYDLLKRRASTQRGLPAGHDLGTVDYFKASGLAGAMAAVLTNPIWVVKTRMLSSGRDAPGAYRGMGHGFATIVRDEGFGGLYRGLLPSLFGVSHGAVQFAVYEVLKKGARTGWKRGADADAEASLRDRSGSWSSQPSGETRPSTLSTILFSTTAKSIATTVTYPYQVIRARLQTYEAGRTYRSLRDVLVQMARGEGVVGFYKGLVPTLIRVLPTTCVVFVTYENCRYYLRRQR